MDRAQFFMQEIPKGNFSLLLESVMPEDEGTYKCIVYTNLQHNETLVKMSIERLMVSGTDKPVYAHASEDVILQCSLDLHIPLAELEVEWTKTDENILVLLFSEGESKPESQNERYWDRAEFFTEEISKGNFSIKLRNVRTEDKGEYMCKVYTDTGSANVTVRIEELGKFLEK
ncbi:butyrophilin-like protein 2-like [Scleropages formosus]|uniref:Butyrophilin-like protein 2-like n=1 Tax=Scleropages formosus TaxID=113540 RepID=A0A0N8JY14_SCLFO|nr:butyrophilin-like protein 2-like [Scleropages formosus]